VALLSRGSLLYACPWVLLFLFHKTERGRPFLWAALSLALLIILIAPVSRGVHWGPRLLLSVLPFLILVYADEKERITQHRWLWGSLVALTLIQALSSAALVYGRKVETAARVEFLRSRIQTPLVVPTQSQIADLAPLFDKVEMFTAPTPASLRRFIADAQRAGVRKFWLLLPHSKDEEPMKMLAGAPMHVAEEWVFETGILWKTAWWVGEFVDAGDSADWGAFYDDLARRELAQGNLQRALPEHKSAVSFAPASADYHYNFAVTLGRLGFYDEASAELHTAIRADSLHRQAQELLAKIREPVPSSSSAHEPAPE
jgi:tetratricopeptide (TPR) repeat protein